MQPDAIAGHSSSATPPVEILRARGHTSHRASARGGAPGPGRTSAADPAPAGERVVVAVTGELDMSTVGPVEHQVAELLESGGEAQVVLDMRAVEFIDSTGLRMLIRLDELARSGGRRFGIVEGTGPVRRLLELTRMGERFTHEPE